MFQDDIFHFSRVHVLSAWFDQLFLRRPSFKPEEPIFVDPSSVSSVMSPVSEGMIGIAFTVPVSLENNRTSYHDFTGLPRRQNIALIVFDPKFN
jgi:hypothetical protein